MDAFSDLEDSQATQILLDLMPARSSSVLSAQPVQASLAAPPDATSDSFGSSRHSTSLPTYHYHGLASTQTQTQLIPEEQPLEEGSQKENIQSATTSEARPPPSRPSTSKGTAAKAALPEQSIAYSKTKASNPRPVAINIQGSPRGRPTAGTSKAGKGASKKPPSRTFPSRHSKRKEPTVSSRDSSQDSFARAPSQDREEQFVAVNRQFELPLSELGRVHFSTNDGSDVPSPNRSSMYAYSRSNGREPIVASQHGKVLVDGTPSNSAGSQSQPSQSVHDTQIIEHHYGNVPATTALSDGYESSESFGRSLLAGGDTQPSPQRPTQEFVQTQPVEDVGMVGPIAAWPGNPTGTSHATTGLSYGATAGTRDSNNPPSNPRSLVSLVNPNNRWRYTKYREREGLQQLAPVVDNSPARGSKQAGQSAWEETQPTTEEDLHPLPRRTLPMPRSTRVAPGTNPSGPLPKLPIVDTMEIVPDSEPLHSPSPPQRRRADDTESDVDIPQPAKKTPRRVPAAKNKLVVASDGDTEEEDDRPLAKPVAVPRARDEEEDSDDDDDDIPLAVKSAKGRKGKGAARVGRPTRSTTAAAKPADVPRHKVTDKRKLGRKPVAKAREPVAAKTWSNRSWEMSVIPSSIPERETVLAPLPKGGKGNREPSNTRSTRSTNSSRAKNYQDPPTEDEQEEEGPIDDLGDLSSLTGAGDQTTEPGDNDYMQVDPHEPGPSSRKRKRTVTQPAAKQEKKRGAKQVSPAIKRLRSAAGSSKAGVNLEPTRVFALWKQDGHFYPGSVYSVQDSSRYLVKFDDNTEAPVTIEQMRMGELRHGDDVLLADRPLSCKVVKVDKLVDKLVTVKVDGTNTEVGLGQLRIAHRTITYAWSDRMLTKNVIVPTLRPKSMKLSPSPSKMSMVSIPHHKGNAKKKILARTGLVITLSVTNENWEKDKERVMTAVKSTGGTVVDDLGSLFHMEGKYEDGGGRWTISQGDVKWGGKSIERLFLLADDANQKPKFLMALALGIPCVSTSWLHHCVEAGEEKDWTSFMLPQGFSEPLGVRLSQQVDVDWGNSIHQLEHIMSNAVPNKLLRNASVLCIGHDMMPQPKGRCHPNNQGGSQEAINALVRIILCMGADTVEAVLQPELARAPFNNYTYIITRSLKNEWRDLPRSKLVDWAWVKNCLLASRLMDKPYGEDDFGLENSQEA